MTSSYFYSRSRTPFVILVCVCFLRLPGRRRRQKHIKKRIKDNHYLFQRGKYVRASDDETYGHVAYSVFFFGCWEQNNDDVPNYSRPYGLKKILVVLCMNCLLYTSDAADE